MYLFHNVKFDFMQVRYWCGFQLWRGRIKNVSFGA